MFSQSERAYLFSACFAESSKQKVPYHTDYHTDRLTAIWLVGLEDRQANPKGNHALRIEIP